MVNNDPTHTKIIETDASNLAKGAVLSQLEPDNRYHPIAFYSKKFSDAELNYDIHDKEMVLIVEAFKEWSHFLCGTGQRVIVYKDHKNLEYFNSTKVLNPHQARWAEILSEFDFVISYCPEVQHGKADALSCRLDPELEGGSAAQISMFKPGQLLQILKSDQLLVQLLSPKGKVPTKGSALAAGYDFYSAEDAIIAPHSRAVISIYIAILIPPGTYGRIAPRLGLAVKFSIDISAGVIDADYCGNVRILIINHSNEVFQIRERDRVVQLVLECIQTPDTATIAILLETDRGDKGFGSTGVTTAKVNQVVFDQSIMLIKARSTAANDFVE